MNVEFESVYILKPILTKEEKSKIIEKLCALIDKKGKVNKIENIGLKQLAYSVKGFAQGHYLIMDFEVAHDNYSKDLSQIEEGIRTIEEVLKFIVIRKED